MEATFSPLKRSRVKLYQIGHSEEPGCLIQSFSEESGKKAVRQGNLPCCLKGSWISGLEGAPEHHDASITLRILRLHSLKPTKLAPARLRHPKRKQSSSSGICVMIGKKVGTLRYNNIADRKMDPE